MRPLRYLNGRTPSPVPAEAGHSNPQPEIGKVVRKTVNHGCTIYATHEEWVRYRYVQAASGVAMLVSFIGLGTFKLCFKNVWN